MAMQFASGGSTPVALPGPKRGFLYVKVIEAGNLGAFDHASGYCEPSAAGCGFACCGDLSSAPTQLHVSITCSSHVRAVSSTGAATVNTKTKTATFNEELLERSLSFCAADLVTFKLQSKSATFGETSMPLRFALPPPFVGVAPPAPLPPCSLAFGAASNGRGSGIKFRDVDVMGDEPLGGIDQVDDHERDIVDPAVWLPRQRITLKPPGRSSAESAFLSATGARIEQPYIDIQVLQLVEGSLPRLKGTTPLLLALEQQQEQLVRAYLALGAAESLPSSDQSACLSAAIGRRSRSIVVMLLHHLKPSFSHLMAAVRMGATDLVEVLLQCGGPALLHPLGPRSVPSQPLPSRAPWARALDDWRQRQTQGGIGTGTLAGDRMADLTATAAPAAFAAAAAANGVAARADAGSFTEPARMTSDDDEEAQPALPRTSAPLVHALPSHSAPSAPSMDRPRSPIVTPLALACSLGDVSMVTTLCQWARCEKVHIDPTAPLALGLSAPAATPGAPPCWDRDVDGAPCVYGDPPMIMAVRARASMVTKQLLISTLAQFGFSADVRSAVDSWTPLLAAVELGSTELVTALLKLGARLSSDKQLGFTPLHLACQTGQWVLVPVLVEAMQTQYSRVAAWGPSPQYVTLNVADSYGRTALDIALQRYFTDYEPTGGDSQKAADTLRQFIRSGQPTDPNVVCGCEVLRVLRLLEALPSEKGSGAGLVGGGLQLFGAPSAWSDVDSPSIPATPHRSSAPGASGRSLSSGGEAGDAAASCDEPYAARLASNRNLRGALRQSNMELCEGDGDQYGDVEVLLQAVRVLVQAGAQTRWPTARTSTKDDLVRSWPRLRFEGSHECSVIDPEDFVPT
eukprot:TRINITY_DN5342_c1_g1_i1.p1 TRINITY_DN5342_c1_g1~~TRINITY_DN5342_c1_g1_i1.p1  ORF type:complete len:869 (-),score=120.90 TRINITY_DN5342_c1_g1_i1:97-2664(-)